MNEILGTIILVWLIRFLYILVDEVIEIFKSEKEKVIDIKTTLGEYTEDQWAEEIKIQGNCNHSIFGSCIIPCPECKTYGFYSPHIDNGRKYRLCKWCGFGQKVGGEPYRCYTEICPKCYPEDCREKFRTSKEVSNSEKDGIRFTQFPGHPCPKCGTTMEIWNRDFNPMESSKEEIYKIHQY